MCGKELSVYHLNAHFSKISSTCFIHSSSGCLFVYEEHDFNTCLDYKTPKVFT